MSLIPLAKTQFTDANGVPLAMGTVTFYVPSTSTAKDTFQDAGLTVLNTNPVQLDAAGRAIIYGSGAYRQLVKDTLGNTVWDQTVTLPDSFTQSGAGAVTRNAEAKLREIVSVADFGAVGNASANDSPAFTAALTANAGGIVHVPFSASGYKLGTAITIPADTTLHFTAGDSQSVVMGFTGGDLFTLGNGAKIIGGSFQGPSGTGRCFVLSGTNGKQRIIGWRAVSGWQDYIIYIAAGAGSQSIISDFICGRDDGVNNASPLKVAIKIEDTGTAYGTACPIRIARGDFNGKPSISFGSTNICYVDDCYLADLEFSDASRGVTLSGRIGNQTALTIKGANHVLQGDFLPVITLASGTDNTTIIGSYNSGFPIDNSGNSRNTICHWTGPYTPALTSGGTAPSLGNGTLTGFWSRSGSQVHWHAELMLGSTTTLGSGDLRFSLPTPPAGGATQELGTVIMNHSGTIYTGFAQNPSGANYASLLRDTSGSVTFNSPVAFATGDTIRVSGTYSA